MYSTAVFARPFLMARITTSPPNGRRLVGIAQHGSFAARSFHAQLAYSGVSTARIQTAEGEVAIFLAGELHEIPTNDPAKYALEAYLQRGPDFVARLHGSFAIFVADVREDSFSVLTDPVNSRSVFWLRRGDFTWLATAHAFPALRAMDGAVDPTAVAQYMVNGIPLNHRTLFSGIRIMSRAGIHRFDRGDWRTRTYWSAEYLNGAFDSERGREQLADLLISAIRRRTADRPRAYVSLSGGYDSPAILGLMHRLGYEDVHCFSYAAPGEGSAGDSRVAAALCRSLGYEHSILPAYRATLLELLSDNVTYGRGLTRLIVEIDAWKQIGSVMATTPSAALFVGDECFGGPSPRPNERGVVTDQNVLLALGLIGLSGLPWLSAWLPSETLRRWEHDLRADLLGMLDRASGMGDPCDRCDYLYLDQRLARILAWRERKTWVAPSHMRAFPSWTETYSN